MSFRPGKCRRCDTFHICTAEMRPGLSCLQIGAFCFCNSYTLHTIHMYGIYDTDTFAPFSACARTIPMQGSVSLMCRQKNTQKIRVIWSIERVSQSKYTANKGHFVNTLHVGVFERIDEKAATHLMMAFFFYFRSYILRKCNAMKA